MFQNTYHESQMPIKKEKTNPTIKMVRNNAQSEEKAHS